MRSTSFFRVLDKLHQSILMIFRSSRLRKNNGIEFYRIFRVEQKQSGTYYATAMFCNVLMTQDVWNKMNWCGVSIDSVHGQNGCYNNLIHIFFLNFIKHLSTSIIIFRIGLSNAHKKPVSLLRKTVNMPIVNWKLIKYRFFLEYVLTAFCFTWHKRPPTPLTCSSYYLQNYFK